VAEAAIGDEDAPTIIAAEAVEDAVKDAVSNDDAPTRIAEEAVEDAVKDAVSDDDATRTAPVEAVEELEAEAVAEAVGDPDGAVIDGAPQRERLVFQRATLLTPCPQAVRKDPPTNKSDPDTAKSSTCPDVPISSPNVIAERGFPFQHAM
jgi:hypothetical protein